MNWDAFVHTLSIEDLRDLEAAIERADQQFAEDTTVAQLRAVDLCTDFENLFDKELRRERDLEMAGDDYSDWLMRSGA